MFTKPIGKTLNHIIEIEKEKLLVHYNYQKEYNKEGDKMIGHELILESINLIEANEDHFQVLFLEKVAEHINMLDDEKHQPDTTDIFNTLANSFRPQTI